MRITGCHKIKRPLPASARLVAAFIAAALALASGAAGADGPPQEKKSQSKTQEAPRDRQQRDQEARDQDDPVRLHSDLVVVSVTVTDAGGHYAHGLGLKDFALFEDNTPQSLESFAAEEAPFAAAIVIDMSGSMEYKFGLVRAAAASFIEHIRDNDQVAVYGFNNKVRQFQDFTNTRDISEYIWDAKAEDMTRLYDGLDEAINALAARPERRRAIVLITDGCDNTSRNASLDSVMKKALSAGVIIYSVDLIDDDALLGGGALSAALRRGRADMKEFSNQSGGRYLHSPQGDKLEEAFVNIVDELRNQYTLTYYSTNTKRDGRYRKINVGVSRAGAAVRARRGYWAAR
jgi:Ca-activated chloride channel family protein